MLLVKEILLLSLSELWIDAAVIFDASFLHISEPKATAWYGLKKSHNFIMRFDATRYFVFRVLVCKLYRASAAGFSSKNLHDIQKNICKV